MRLFSNSNDLKKNVNSQLKKHITNSLKAYTVKRPLYLIALLFHNEISAGETY